MPLLTFRRRGGRGDSTALRLGGGVPHNRYAPASLRVCTCITSGMHLHHFGYAPTPVQFPSGTVRDKLTSLSRAVLEGRNLEFLNGSTNKNITLVPTKMTARGQQHDPHRSFPHPSHISPTTCSISRIHLLNIPHHLAARPNAAYVTPARGQTTEERRPAPQTDPPPPHVLVRQTAPCSHSFLPNVRHTAVQQFDRRERPYRGKRTLSVHINWVCIHINWVCTCITSDCFAPFISKGTGMHPHQFPSRTARDKPSILNF